MTRDWKRILLVVGIAITVIIADQITKQLAILYLKGRPTQSYLADTLRVLYVENDGAFLSLGAGLDENLRFWLLTLAPIIVLLFLLAFTLFSLSLNRWQVIAYSLVLGGGISNIYDRLLYGSVVDFLNLGIGGLRTGIFNVADMAIMTGLFLLLPTILRGKPKDETEPRPNPPNE
jgi:signal peptidase II